MKLPAWFTRAFPAPSCGCGTGGMCWGSPDCGDRLCPGNPRAAASYSHVDPLPLDYAGPEPRELSEVTKAIVIAGVALALGIVAGAAILGTMP